MTYTRVDFFLHNLIINTCTGCKGGGIEFEFSFGRVLRN